VRMKASISRLTPLASLITVAAGICSVIVTLVGFGICIFGYSSSDPWFTQIMGLGPLLFFPVFLLSFYRLRIAVVALWVLFALTYAAYFCNNLRLCPLGHCGGKLLLEIGFGTFMSGPHILPAFAVPILMQIVERLNSRESSESI
jgi:hypothetical protein